MVRTNELIAERARAGFSRKDAAAACGCSTNTYALKETGKASFTTEEVVALCDAMGIDDIERRGYIFLALPSRKMRQNRSARAVK
ncbi:MAG: helix-turn-helix domain-containing protein [Clostridia bacterium]|nr:helix-turn-helix domain-containing protein [Clostridia bacterium]